MTTTRTQPPETPRPCRSCGVAIILAHPPGRPDAWAPYDARDLDLDSTHHNLLDRHGDCPLGDETCEKETP